MNKKEIKKKMKECAQKAYDLMNEIERDKDGNPLTLEGAIRSILLKRPTARRYRDDALDTLYCVLGSGIDWSKEGRLIDTCENNYMNMPPEPGLSGCWSRDFGSNEALKLMFEGHPKILKRVIKGKDERMKKEAEEVIETIDTIDERCQLYRPITRYYPISWRYCHLCCPASAQEDFFNGAIETATLILTNTPRPGTQEWIDNQRTKGYAKEILDSLMIRKNMGEEKWLDLRQ